MRGGTLGAVWGGLALAAGGAGCSNGNNDPGGGEIFVPDLSKVWNEQGKSAHNFQFRPTNAEAKVRAAAFTGDETDPPDAFNFIGFFQDASITLSYSDGSAKDGFTYTGTIGANSMTITLMRGNERLILIKPD